MDVSAVQRQLEFYFSDANLSKDRFLRRKLEDDKDSYVDISVLASFNRMKALAGGDEQLLRRAVNASPELELSADGTRVRRTQPVGDNLDADADGRTVYVENLPAKSDHDTLREFFAPCGPVVYVRTSIPRFKVSREIKGFASIEFATQEAAERAVEMDEFEKNDKGLRVMSKATWLCYKQQYKELRRETTAEFHRKHPVSHYPHIGDPDAKGLVLHFRGTTPRATKEDVRAKFTRVAHVAYLDYTEGKPEGYVRFYRPEGTRAALDAITTEAITVDGNVLQGRCLEGQEEDEYWKRIEEGRRQWADRIATETMAKVKKDRGGEGSSVEKAGKKRKRKIRDEEEKSATPSKKCATKKRERSKSPKKSCS